MTTKPFGEPTRAWPEDVVKAMKFLKYCRVQSALAPGVGSTDVITVANAVAEHNPQTYTRWHTLERIGVEK